MPKNLKVLTFPSNVNYLNNEKFIIEEVNFVILFNGILGFEIFYLLNVHDFNTF